MANNKRIFSLPVIVAFIALIFPLLATQVNDDNTPNLTGMVISNEKPVLSRASWFSRQYQDDRDAYNDDHWAFKESMVRLNNQFYYDAFNQIRLKGFVSGKDDYVFSENYIFSAFGDDLMPEEKVSALLEKAKVVQDTLIKKGIDLLLVFAPGKGVACKEFIEDKYVHPVKTTNHALFLRHSSRLQLNVLDLYSYFEKLKPYSPYPLFPRFGHHWSYYAEYLAVDTIIGHIERLHGVDMPGIFANAIDVVDTARSRDADVLKGMNLWKNPEQRMKLAYPEIMFEADENKNTTSVLTIGDSYWYGPVYMGVPQHCFASGKFWYYYNKVVPNVKGQKVGVWELDLKHEIESNEVIMVLYSDGNLPGFGNGFIEDAYELYTSPKTYYARASRTKMLNVYVKQIRESPALLKRAIAKSEDLNITLDSAVQLDASRMAGMQINE
jgi:hypothetical protein